MSTASGSAPEEAHRCVRCQTLVQENVVLHAEVEVLRLRCKNLQEENKALRRASVSIQAQAEQEEEYISNTLMKKIQALKKEKETLAVNYEQEEEFLTNDLTRKLNQLRQEKVELEQTLEQEQEYKVNKLMKKIEKLEGETTSKQSSLEQLRREKVDLENALEQEQEMLMNRLWKRMDRLEAEKRMLEERLGQLTTPPPSPLPPDQNTATLSGRVKELQGEVKRLTRQLNEVEARNLEKTAAFEEEEKAIQEENVRLQRRLILEIERRENLSRQLSESESSLEMEDERHFNEYAKDLCRSRSASFGHERSASMSSLGVRDKAPLALDRSSSFNRDGKDVPLPATRHSLGRPSSPVPHHSPTGRRSASPAFLNTNAFTPPSPYTSRHHTYGMVNSPTSLVFTSSAFPSSASGFAKPKQSRPKGRQVQHSRANQKSGHH
ncbi:coiled-coil domain-containing protein 6-like [Corticium candelabrum]|uniref:coiled-coil domain-containing protein 6-like n=1 Tax=Corticium candelabrum TaxID=121492 RepID=UPI002E26DBBB|nr:coiled-coil domain-containing protein 6-like [Corticium candelabrum]